MSKSLCLKDRILGMLPEGKEAVGIGDIIEAIRHNRVRITDHADEEPIHTVWAYNEENQWVVLITVYRPDPQRWIEWRKRRP